MKKIYRSSFLLFSLSFFISLSLFAKGKLDKNSIKICTYNIRGDIPTDGVNCWKFRKDSLCKIIFKYNFDIVCLQEVLANQLEDIIGVTDYAFVGIRGLFNPILYKADRFDLLHTEMFWLSKSMKPYEKGWDGKYERYCTWAKFRDKKTNKVFFVFNTHLDHKGVIAKKEGALLICKQIERFVKNEPVFITGDMNSFDTTDTYEVYTSDYKDSRRVASNVYGPIGTAHNFGIVHPVRIDYIFINKRIHIENYRSIDESYENNFFPSDHYAVFVDAILMK